MKTWLAIFIISLTLLANKAFADDYRAKGIQINSRAQDAVNYMHKAGIANPMLVNAAYYVDEHIEDNRFTLAQKQFSGINLSLSHDIATPSLNRLELQFAPEDSNYGLRASKDSVMIYYKRDISW